MNDIDTAAVRSAWGGDAYEYPAGVILDFCDALDAARAERDAKETVRAGLERRLAEEVARAEAAEAEVSRLTHEFLEASNATARAEARIAAGLAECERLASNETLALYVPGIRRALTGDTNV
jgi:hypothetical protein